MPRTPEETASLAEAIANMPDAQSTYSRAGKLAIASARLEVSSGMRGVVTANICEFDTI